MSIVSLLLFSQSFNNPLLAVDVTFYFPKKTPQFPSHHQTHHLPHLLPSFSVFPFVTMEEAPLLKSKISYSTQTLYPISFYLNFTPTLKWEFAPQFSLVNHLY